MESETQNYGKEFPKKGFSVFLEEVKEMEKDLAEIKKDIAEGKGYLEEEEKDLQFFKEMNEAAKEEGFKGYSPEETEKAQKAIEDIKKCIAQLESAKSRIDGTIMRWRAIDSRWEDILVKGTPPTEH